MLTRLKVSGFKNLDVDVRFGPFVCIAGPNGVGKSNLFDAIAFISALANKPLMEAALSVRGGAGRMNDVRGLFRRAGDQTADVMSFLVEMIIPAQGEDRTGEIAKASMTYLQYELTLRYKVDQTRPLGALEIVKEGLVHISRGRAARQLGFPHRLSWRKSAILGRRSVPYISTDDKGIVRLHADAVSGLGGGGAQKYPAKRTPRTVLSIAEDAVEHRTAMLARQEMMSWTQLHLEPTALRAPDDFTAPRTMSANGLHLPATLYALAQAATQSERGGDINLYARIANRLSELVEEVRSISVDVDEKRQLLSVVTKDRFGTPHLAGSLSDGTLRFLALAVMLEDPNPSSLICLEEPENGMHPQRIPAMLRILQDLAMDTAEPIGSDNPLRQVIINTHSPSVVAEVEEDALLVARPLYAGAALDSSGVAFSPLPGTWRTRMDPETIPVPRVALLAYLDPLGASEELRNTGEQQGQMPRRIRVKDREDLQLFLPFDRAAAE